MGFNLQSYIDNGLSVPNAYLHIADIIFSVVEKTFILETAIYASKTLYKAGEDPLQTRSFEFINEILINGEGPQNYTTYFTVVPAASPLTNTIPTTADDILWTIAYLALPNHPEATTLLAGAIPA